MKAPELTVAVRELEVQLDNMGRRLDGLDQSQERIRDGLNDLKQTVARIDQRLTDHVAHVEKWDARRWTTIGFFVAGLITLVANLILLFVKGK